MSYKWMINWKGFDRKRSRPNFKVPSRKIAKHLSQDNRSLGRYLNPGPPEHETGVLTTWLRCSVHEERKWNVPRLARQTFFCNRSMFSLWKTVTNFIVHSLLSETNSRQDSQTITRCLWNPEIYYRLHNSPSLVHKSQMNPFQALKSY
jgi:hypothetical protein